MASLWIKFEPTGKFTVKADLSKLKIFEKMESNPKSFSLIERNIHDAVFAYKQIYDEKKKKRNKLSKLPWTYF